MSRIFNEQELDALTDEERAGLEDEDLVDDTTEVDLGNATAADEAGKGSADADAAKEAATEQQANAATEEAVTAEAQVHKPKPLFDATLPDDIEAKIADIKNKKTELHNKFDEGDITVADYQAAIDNLNDQHQDLREAKFKASLAQEAQKSQELNTWEQSCNDFLSKHPDIAGDELKYNSFDVAVRMITNDPANAALSGPAMLEKAYARWSASFGGVAQPAAEQKPKGEKGTTKQVVPNIGGLPASDVSETDTSRFKALDDLIDTDPLRYQDELMKLSASDRAAYLAC